MIKVLKVAALATVLCWASGAQANLLTNGGFEASNSPTATPPGWVNIGHSDGIITYASFGTPVYEGLNYYDLGGYGDPGGPIGDGIAQSFATIAGAAYTVSFGLSGENLSGVETLTVAAGNASFDYVLTPTGQTFQRPFTTQTFAFTATGALTTLSFVHTAGQGGNNDPLIDGVSVTPSAVPEPASLALMMLGLGVVGMGRVRRRT
jgi:hypothetical protein